ncbi:hypothetical protein GCM10009847_10550 [Leucobacter tardus]|uniref:Lsr2 family protein n=1 Tax=Leucobacter tardus TaxID=501483 RepID=A0A939QBN7_9MICO|nr:histone-like nucleoid-structuring protein Lsr2 [Leucobacter tardus]MBO2989252.1 Lsr2 family protein [Leucobacter tardus]
MADVVMKVDDLDGTPIPPGQGGTVHFGFRGAQYAIDLTSEHEEELAGLLTPYIRKAREAESLESLNGEPPLATDEADREMAKLLQAEAKRNLKLGKKPYDTIAAREWLTERGVEFNQMGRLAKEYREIYERHFGLPSYDLAAKHSKG